VLQAEHLSEWVTAKSTERGVRSIVAVALYSGPEVSLDDTVLVRASIQRRTSC